MECTITASPSRTTASMATSCGRFMSLPDALSVNILSTTVPSRCRAVFWSRALTLVSPTRCPVIVPSPAEHVRLDSQNPVTIVSINHDADPNLTVPVRGA
jgi:hypothetical protein